ncbi:MAG TPA: hypothetical protein VG742_01080 [Dongiaceae bacterium]|nr:hypothetical protein [Dongiaceae bacterium]
MPNAFTEADARDTQALVKTGFGKLQYRYLLLRIDDPAQARAWLRALRLRNMTEIGDGQKVDQAIQLAVSVAGLRTLGHGDLVTAFSPEFEVGLGDDPSRARRLGDVGANDPAHWDWGTGLREPHVLLMLFADAADVDALAARLSGEARTSGLSTIDPMLPNGTIVGREPFGFLDGISQPVLDFAGRRTPGGADDMDFHNFIATGEVLLGYPNEYGLYTERPLLDARVPGAGDLPPAADEPRKHDLGRNGSYLVFRQLHQDVRGFWRWLYAQAGEDGAVALAEAMVGRRLENGEPFTHLGRAEIPGIDPNDRQNSFTYRGDPDGRVCPIGAHIRRANPRTGDYPQGRMNLLKKLVALLGLSGTPEQDRIASTRFHRILRRGRAYGAPLDHRAAAQPGGSEPETGLHFICLNANPARQFEFIQGAWLASAKFAGMSHEQDPMLGNRIPFPGDQPTDRFTRPQAEGRCLVSHNVPQFVTVKGGAYFFLPGLRAKDWLLRER